MKKYCFQSDQYKQQSIALVDCRIGLQFVTRFLQSRQSVIMKGNQSVLLHEYEAVHPLTQTKFMRTYARA